MNTSSTRHTGAALATASAVAAGLTVMSAMGPVASSAHRPDPLVGPTTQCVGDVGGVDGAGTIDIAEDIAHRKAEMAQSYVDTPRLHGQAVR